MSKRLKWVYPFSVMGRVSHSQCVLQLMMTHYVKKPDMVSILSDGVSKPFSVPSAADDDLLCKKCLKQVYPFSVMGWASHSQCALQLMMTCYVESPKMGISILSDGVSKPFSVLPADDDDLTIITCKTHSTKQKITSKNIFVQIFLLDHLVSFQPLNFLFYWK